MEEASVVDQSVPARSSGNLIARLAAMMFLQYWPLGTWGVTFGSYIAANTGERGIHAFSGGFVGYSTAAGAIGSLLSPVLIGFLSDRYVSAERLMSLMHAGCAIAVWQMSQTHSQIAFFLWLLVYYECFSPACALTNKIALRHLTESSSEYPVVRLFGTIGWIAAGLFIGFAWPAMTGGAIETTTVPLVIGAVGNIAMAVYCVTLPRTPPQLKSGRIIPSANRDSRDLFRNRQFVAFLVIVFFACAPTMAYNNYGNVFLNDHHYWHPAALMTIGQVSEALVLAASPWIVSIVPLPALFAAGIAAWSLRYLLLALASSTGLSAPVYIAIAIHGMCYVFVYIVGVIYVDRLVSPTHRGLAQGTFTIVYAGFANLFGALSVGYSQSRFLTPEGVSPPPYNWTIFWLIPAAQCALTAILFVAILWRIRAAARLRPT
jgi:nucleoside transporter